MNLRNLLAKNYINSVGWKTKRKLLLIESDDWGSIHMPSIQTANRLKNIGVNIDDNYFDKYDNIESNDDFIALFEMLSQIIDYKGHPAIVSAEYIVSNPDFEKIDASDKNYYIPESFVDTYKRYSMCDNSFKLLREGIDNNFIHPQFHGREHINVARWIKKINAKSLVEKIAFNERAIIGSGIGEPDYSIYRAFEYQYPDEGIEINKIITDGLKRFEEIFGFKTKSFVSPTGCQGVDVNNFFANNGVLFCQMGSQYIMNGSGKSKKIDYKWGETDNNGITFWRRNSNFEPSRDKTNFDVIEKCFKEVSNAFFWGKPAVISSHRVNYIGSLYESNRTENLDLLKNLLQKIQKTWPEVEFISSSQLADLINKKGDV